MKMTEPYSPTARAKASPVPVTSGGRMAGMSTRVKVCIRVAPSVAAASSFSRLSSIRTGCSVRTMKGSPTKVSATRMPSGV